MYKWNDKYFTILQYINKIGFTLMWSNLFTLIYTLNRLIVFRIYTDLLLIRQAVTQYTPIYVIYLNI